MTYHIWKSQNNNIYILNGCRKVIHIAYVATKPALLMEIGDKLNSWLIDKEHPILYTTKDFQDALYFVTMEVL